MLEFGFAGKPPSATQALLERIAGPVGIAIRSVQYRTRLAELLEETRKQSEELRAHTEELSVANEELEEQSRALMDGQKRLELRMARLLADNRGGNLTGEQVSFAHTIESSGNDLLILINDILDISKIEAGKLDLRPENTSIPGMVERLSASFTHQASQKGLAFEVVVSPDAPETLALPPPGGFGIAGGAAAHVDHIA